SSEGGPATMRLIRALAMTACMTSAGFGQDRGTPEPPSVSDDPGQIAEVRKLHAQEEDTVYQEAFERLRGLGVLVSRHEEALGRRKDQARAELKRIMEDAAAPDEYRARAARTLITLGDRSGEDFLLDAVQTGRGPRRAAALQTLDDWDRRRWVD